MSIGVRFGVGFFGLESLQSVKEEVVERIIRDQVEQAILEYPVSRALDLAFEKFTRKVDQGLNLMDKLHTENKK
jgi:hypothetical protein